MPGYAADKANNRAIKPDIAPCLRVVVPASSLGHLKGEEAKLPQGPPSNEPGRSSWPGQNIITHNAGCFQKEIHTISPATSLDVGTPEIPSNSSPLKAHRNQVAPYGNNLALSYLPLGPNMASKKDNPVSAKIAAEYRNTPQWCSVFSQNICYFAPTSTFKYVTPWVRRWAIAAAGVLQSLEWRWTHSYLTIPR